MGTTGWKVSVQESCRHKMLAKVIFRVAAVYCIVY